MPTTKSSSDVVVQSPLSVTGALGRVGRMWRHHVHGAPGIAVAVLLVVLAIVWVGVALVWTVVFGILLVPYRVVRRGQRRRKLEERRHAELLEAARRAE